jgi:hypothetical protein
MARQISFADGRVIVRRFLAATKVRVEGGICFAVYLCRHAE